MHRFGLVMTDDDDPAACVEQHSRRTRSGICFTGKVSLALPAVAECRIETAVRVVSREREIIKLTIRTRAAESGKNKLAIRLHDDRIPLRCRIAERGYR